jgi:hypothetical protein
MSAIHTDHFPLACIIVLPFGCCSLCLQLNTYLLSDKFEGRKRFFMRYGGLGLYIALSLIAIVALFTTVKNSEK